MHGSFGNTVTGCARSGNHSQHCAASNFLLELKLINPWWEDPNNCIIVIHSLFFDVLY